MNKSELKQIIAQIESTNSKDEAYFGIFETGDVDQGDSFIKGNIEGLSLFAVEILNAAYNTVDKDETGNSDERQKSTIYPIDAKVDWIDQSSTFRITYIESSDEPREKAIFHPHIKSWKDKVFEFGCLLLLFLAFITMIVGIFTIVKWLI